MAIVTDKFYTGDSATNTVEEIVTIGHTSTGTPAAGLGAALGLAGENSNSEVVSAAQIIGYLSTVTDNSEAGVYQVKLRSGGALSTLLSFTTPLAGDIGTPDGDVILTLGRMKMGALATDRMDIAHYDRFNSTDWAFRQSSAGATSVNSVSTGTLANSGTNSIQWTNGRMIGGPALGTLNVRFAGVLDTNITAVGNVGSGVDDLMSYTVPAAQLPTNKDALNFEMVFKTAANANNKQIKVFYGATTLYDSGVVAANDDQLVVRGRIIRTGAATQIAHITAIGNAGGAFTDTVTLTTPAETLSGTVVLKATGEATSDNDIQQIYQTIIWEPAT